MILVDDLKTLIDDTCKIFIHDISFEKYKQYLEDSDNIQIQKVPLEYNAYYPYIFMIFYG